MTEPYTIRITLEDIYAGMPQRPDRCPTGIAASRVFYPHLVWWAYETGRLLLPNDRTGIIIPVDGQRDAVKAWVKRFDAGEAVEPISFHVRVFTTAGEWRLDGD